MSIKVSIIIKALNEQINIERTLQSALAAVAAVGGEVILADSGSTDRTVEIAKTFPVRIVQLANPAEKSCGIGAQLGYQIARGECIYILDADMEISHEFLLQALLLIEQNANLAAVGGMVQEMQMGSLEFQARVLRDSADMQAGIVAHLAGGGLYRKSAIAEIGYLTNRNLHSYEEFELGVRLRAAGWKLMRLPLVSVKHYGHTMPAYQLLRRRWSSRYAQGVGELVRASIGKPHMPLLLKELKELRLYIAVIFWWLAIVVLALLLRPVSTMLIAVVLMMGLPFVAMVLKKRSFALGTYAVVAWQYFSAGLVLGFFRKQTTPTERIANVVLSTNKGGIGDGAIS